MRTPVFGDTVYVYGTFSQKVHTLLMQLFNILNLHTLQCQKNTSCNLPPPTGEGGHLPAIGL